MTRTYPILFRVTTGDMNLDEEGVDNFYRTVSINGLASRNFINPYKTALKESTEFDNDNVPDKEEIIDKSFGDVDFSITVTPRHNNPKYEEVLSGFESYLDHVESDYSDGRQRAGVITIDQEPYIDLNEVKLKLDELVGEVRVEGVKITPKIIKPTYGRDDIEKMAIALELGNDISLERDSESYVKASSIYDVNMENITSFQNRLIEKSPFSADRKPPKTTGHWEPIGSHLFRIPNIPKTSISYGSVVQSLVRETVKQGKTTGELFSLIQGWEFEHQTSYAIRERGEIKYIKLDGLRQRLESLKKSNTSDSLTQKPIEHYPVVEWYNYIYKYSLYIIDNMPEETKKIEEKKEVKPTEKTIEKTTEKTEVKPVTKEAKIEEKEVPKEPQKPKFEITDFNPWTVLKYPHLAEKSMNMVEMDNKLVFMVDRRARKEEIKKAIEKGFNVKVESVNVLITQKGVKKAYAKLDASSDAVDIASRLGML